MKRPSLQKRLFAKMLIKSDGINRRIYDKYKRELFHDVFLCTLVLCSVPHPAKTIAEMKRVLKPNGKLIIIEHVASTRRSLLMWQYLLNPLVQAAADGCHCTRRTWVDIEQGGFSKVQLDHFDVEGPLLVHKPHIIGYAIK